MKQVEQTIDQIVSWLQERVRDAGAKGLVFGLSGGIDSAVIAGLAKRAFPEDALGVIMPVYSNPEDEAHAILVAEKLDLETTKVDLGSVYDAFLLAAGKGSDAAASNVKPRLRMTTLYYLGQSRGYLVCGSSNASEFYLGYFTKFGDSGADLLPIVSFLKDDIYELGRALGIPREILEKAPSAGLWEGQTDEGEMGFSYKELNDWIRDGIKGEHIDRIIDMHEKSEHKRLFPPHFEA